MSLYKRRTGRKTHTKQKALNGVKTTFDSFLLRPAGVDYDQQLRYRNGTIDFAEVRSGDVQITWANTLNQSTSPKYLLYNYIDESGLPRKIEYPAFKWCQHSRAKHSFKPGRSVTFYYPPGDRDWEPAIYETTYGRLVNTHPSRLPCTISDLITLGVAVPPGKMFTKAEHIAQQKFASLLKDDAMMLNFRDGFSILTFLAELTDLANLPNLLKKWTKSSRDVSDKYLGVQFGVLPFVNDLKAIFKRLLTLDSQLEAWNTMAQDGQVRNYHITLNDVASELKIGTRTWNYSENRPHPYRSGFKPPKNYYKVVCTQNVVAKAHIYIAPIVINPASLNAIKQHIWGAEDFLSTAWEKVPFSFVVDWFTGLGSVISSWHESPSYLQYKILSAGISIRCVTKWVTTQGTSDGSSEHGTHEGEVIEYYRSPIPTTAAFTEAQASLNFKLLTEKQATLGAALIHQSIKR